MPRQRRCSYCRQVHPVRRGQRMLEHKENILSVLRSVQPRAMTIRGLFYLMVTAKMICKTEDECKSLSKVTGDMREAGELEWEWIVDNTRMVRRPTSYSSFSRAIDGLAAFYESDPWLQQDHRVEVWCEKSTLNGLVLPITEKWHVPFMASGGFASKTFVHEAAKATAESGKPTYVYMLGDHDPSGERNELNLEERLRRYAPDAEIHYEKIGILPKHITHDVRGSEREEPLPTRPTKTEGNAHARGEREAYWSENESVEVDALPPDELEHIVEAAILRHYDHFKAMDVSDENRGVINSLMIYRKNLLDSAENITASFRNGREQYKQADGTYPDWYVEMQREHEREERDAALDGTLVTKKA